MIFDKYERKIWDLCWQSQKIGDIRCVSSEIIWHWNGFEIVFKAFTFVMYNVSSAIIKEDYQ